MSHYPRKRFGQHFLSNPEVISRIVDAISPNSKDTIVEIGPGKGALTYPLLNQVAQIHAIEVDSDLAKLLEQEVGQSDKLQIHRADALKVDFAKLLGAQRARIVGNLPYNISTPLLFHLTAFQEHIIDMYLMLQREVVARLTAAVGSKHYGRLSVMARCCFEIEARFDIPPQAFEPPPKVISTLAYFKPQPQLSPQSLKELDKIVRLAFSGRRKTVANALSELFSKQSLEKMGIDPSQRVDNLGLDQFLCMLKYTADNRGEDATK